MLQKAGEIQKQTWWWKWQDVMFSRCISKRLKRTTGL